MAKISTLMIGLVLAGAIIGLLGMSISNIALETGQTYDNTTFQGLNKVDQVRQETEVLKDKVTTLTSSDNWRDKLNALFGAGYSAFSSTIKSFTVGSDVITSGLGLLNLGEGGGVIIGAILVIITIVVVFILIKVLLKADV